MSLFIWKYTFDRRGNNIPKNASLWLTDDKSEKSITSEWIRFNPYNDEVPPSGNMRLPAKLYLHTDLKKKPDFDWLYIHHHIMVVSKRFLSFLKENASGQFETAGLIIFDKQKREFDDQDYFAIRVFKFNNDRFELNESTKKRAAGARGKFTYPDLELTEPQNQKVLFLLSFCYYDCLILTPDGKDHVLKNYISPEIYYAQDYPLVFNNQLKISELPEPILASE